MPQLTQISTLKQYFEGVRVQVGRTLADIQTIDDPSSALLTACMKAINATSICIFQADATDTARRKFKCLNAVGENADAWLSVDDHTCGAYLHDKLTNPRRYYGSTIQAKSVFEDHYFSAKRHILAVAIRGSRMPSNLCAVLSFDRRIDGGVEACVIERFVDLLHAHNARDILNTAPTPFARASVMRSTTLSLLNAILAENPFGITYADADSWFSESLRSLNIAWQPIINLTTKKIEGHEVLVRPIDMRTDEYLEAVRVLGAKGCIALDTTIIRRVCDIIRTGGYNGSMKAFINIHPATLLDTNTMGWIIDSDECQPLRGRAVLEVIEYECDCDFAKYFSSIRQRLFQKDICVALDDAEAHLLLSARAIKPEYIKLSSNRFNAAEEGDFLRSIMQMCLTHRMRLVLERIEDADQLSHVPNFQSLLVQGYIFSQAVQRPFTEKRFTTKVNEVIFYALQKQNI
ncbi:MAG TPA: EAL domain-containing protein [Armatimonadota bacterium]|nr:EAL domain-containing protein [Armatimonadota bacterium]